MTRRSWRDLDQPATTPPTSTPAAPTTTGGTASDLEQAAALAPDSNLGRLLEQRQALEQRLRGMTSGGDSTDPAIAARFPVASFADRQQQERAWQARRDAVHRQQDDLRRAASPAPTRSAPPTPRPATPATPPASGLQDRFAQGSALIGRARGGVDRFESATKPLRDVGRQVTGARDQLRDLDRQLAENDVSERDRAEIREQLGGDTLDKIGGQMDKANAALDAPRRAVDRIDSGWQSRTDQISGAMDRTSAYADMRERRLSPETGGSGDLFERMQRNRMAALRRRQEQQAQDDRDQARRDRASKSRRAEERDAR